MEDIGNMIRRLREAKREPLRKVAAYLDVDQAILSKIERRQRRASKEQIRKLAKYFGADEKEMLVAWLSDKVMYAIGDEPYATEALQAAEEQVAYRKFINADRHIIIRTIRQFLKKDGRVKKAWIFGSFARGDDHPGSDIDIMVEEKNRGKFNYFDLADVQYQLEQLLHRKIDIGFASSLKEYVAGYVKKDAKLVYEDA